MSEVILGAKTTRLSGKLPSVGDKAPDFVLVNKALKNHSLKNYPGKKILFTVPSVDTEMCENTAIIANDLASQFSDLSVLYISCDLPFAQNRVCQQLELNNINTLSLMRDKKFAEDYGVLIAEGSMQGVCARAVFVLDVNNQVVYQQLVHNVSDLPDLDLLKEHC